MESVMGFLLVNVYALLLILVTAILFFRKQRIKQLENETYKNFLLVSIAISFSGIILGISVTPEFAFSNFWIILLNKIYLMCLVMWISILTFYYLYITLGEKINVKKWKNIFSISIIISLFLLIIFPVEIEMTGGSAVASGGAVMFTYSVFAIGFLAQIICVLLNHKGFRNKKYIPLYLLIFLGTIVFTAMLFNPALNYLINPVFVFIAFIMFHTIENPDKQTIEILLRNKELVEQTVNDKSNFLFKVSQEMKKPIKNIIDNSKLYKGTKTEDEKKNIIEEIEHDANNAYFIMNDITDLSSMDFKSIKVQENVYMTKKLFADIKVNIKNQLSLAGKDEKINFKFTTFNSYPEKLNGDNLKLKQAVLSVVSNCIEHTKEGFIEVEVDTIMQYDVCRMVFTIKDSGSGMNIAKVNEMLSSTAEIAAKEFEKIDNLTLDFPVIIKLIKLLGGSVSIKSKEDKGTIVVIVIDQKIAENNEDKALNEIKKYNTSVTSKKRILLADDNLSLEKEKRLLSKYDVDVVTTLMSKDVIRKVNSGDIFDLIIIRDDMKPDSALSILTELKKNNKFKIPVVIIIDKDKEFIKDHFIKDGFNDAIIREQIDKDLISVCDKYL